MPKRAHEETYSGITPFNHHDFLEALLPHLDLQTAGRLARCNKWLDKKLYKARFRGKFINYIPEELVAGVISKYKESSECIVVSELYRLWRRYWMALGTPSFGKMPGYVLVIASLFPRYADGLPDEDYGSLIQDQETIVGKTYGKQLLLCKRYKPSYWDEVIAYNLTYNKSLPKYIHEIIYECFTTMITFAEYDNKELLDDGCFSPTMANLAFGPYGSSDLVDRLLIAYPDVDVYLDCLYAEWDGAIPGYIYEKIKSCMRARPTLIGTPINLIRLEKISVDTLQKCIEYKIYTLQSVNRRMSLDHQQGVLPAEYLAWWREQPWAPEDIREGR